MAIDDAAAVVTGPDGQVQSLGQFLRARKQACGLPVTRIVEAAGISRANFYLLEKDGQRPSLTTLVMLLGAMGLTTRLPAAEDSAQAPDLEVVVGQEVYAVDLRWSGRERSRSRERYLSTASSGLGVALDAFGPSLGQFAGVRLAGGAGARPGVAGMAAAAAPLVVPVLGSALAATARRLRERRAVNEEEAAAAPSQEEVLKDLKETAASMSTEELEALLAAMKSMREDPGGCTEG